MTNEELQNVADQADMIVDGYAFTTSEVGIRVLNLYHPDAALVLDHAGRIIEACMNPIEQQIVLDIWKRNSVFMEGEDA